MRLQASDYLYYEKRLVTGYREVLVVTDYLLGKVETTY